MSFLVNAQGRRPCRSSLPSRLRLTTSHSLEETIIDLTGIRFGPIIEASAKAHGLAPALLAAVAAQETGGPGADSGRNVVGDHGHGRGLFQIDDRYHPFAKTAAAMDPARNADYAASLLRTNLDATGGNLKAALSMYNAGSAAATGTKTTWADGSTLGYADSVLRHVRDIAGDDAASVGALGTAAQTLPASSTSSASSAAPQSLSAPALDLSAGSSQQTTFSYRSFSSEVAAGSSAANDADAKIASLVDSGDDVFANESATS